MSNSPRSGRSGLFALVILLLSLTAATAGAVEYRYVSLDGSDLNSGLRPETPWRTLTRAALDSPYGTTILVGPGEYREDTGGYGHLSIDADQTGLRFEAQGEVILKAARPELRVLHLFADGPVTFAGFLFAGVDSCQYGVTGLARGKRFEDCRFTGSLNWALDLTDGEGCVMDSCDLGEPGAPLNSKGLRIRDCVYARVLDSRFHVTGATCLQLERCDHAELLDNRFGESGDPLDLDGNWALRSVDCDPVLIRDNSIFLSDGHGIGLPLAGRDLLDISIVGNTVVHEAALTQYGLFIGTNQPGAGLCRSPLVEGNHLTALTEPAYCRNLFVINVDQPRVIANTSGGGYYGITLRSCDDAHVEGNLVSAAGYAGIMDKGSRGSEFFGNDITAGQGRCVRLDNDGDRELDASLWHHNTFHSGQLVFEMSSPVDPLAQGIACDWNRYHLAEHDQDFAIALAEIVDFREAGEAWSWERHGEIEVADRSPIVLDESWSLTAFQAILELELSESAQGWLAFGTGSPTDTLFGETSSMRQSFRIEGLAPMNAYSYAYGLCDGEGRCLAGDGEFTTGDETAAPTPGPAAMRLDAPWPNPANPSSRIRFELEREGDVRLSLHDLGGRRLRLLAAGRRSAGAHEIRIDGRDERGRHLGSGVYLIRLEGDGSSLSRKWILIK